MTKLKRKGCSINSYDLHEWEISRIALKKLYPYLYENHEVAGKFDIHPKHKKTSDIITLTKGDKDSVEAPKAIVNYHTHPVSCYLGEETVWGWPSGEDMRESVLFGIKGSVCHITPAIEGVYITQVNPCILENLIHLKDLIDPNDIDKNLMKLIKKHGYEYDDFFRGLIVLCIEVCFRSTHVFRGYDFNKDHKVSAKDFVKFSNVFELANMFSDKNIGNCGDLKCNNIWTFENKIHEKVSFENYSNDFESDCKVYICDKDGEADYSKINLSTAIKHGALDIVKKLDLGSSCKYPKKFWSNNWFLLSLVENDIKLPGVKKMNYNSKKLSADDRMNFIKNTYNLSSNKDMSNYKDGFIFLKEKKLPIFYFFELEGDCDHDHVKQDIKDRDVSFKNSSKELLLIGSPNCSFCKNAASKLSKTHKVTTKYFITIREAIEEANKYAYGSRNIGKIKTIPAVFEVGSKKLLDYNKL